MVAADSAAQIMTGVTLTLTTDGARGGVLSADTAVVDRTALQFRFRRFRFTVFGPDGQLAATLTAPHGSHRIGSDTVTADGGVIIATPTGDSLATARVFFDKAALRFTTDTAFTLLNRGARSQGSGLTIDPTLRIKGSAKRP